MHLKELTVQGYKSFANRHRFVFPSGVTAVVGPNGSGKSNIADAIRWVLGEQRPSHLRARKTDDMIFSGTERRPRAGMAEVHLVLDNEDGWFDVEFAEVQVSRRAHRDGSNEYFINGAKVLLRDVLDLLGAKLGSGTYTVIGQGLVDSALSLRPEERRALIDEAAGIVPLQRKRDRALRRLDETSVNLTRVKDILAELTPRIRRMERLAERAERHDALAADLAQALRQWYGYQWGRARDALKTAREAANAIGAEVAEARKTVTDRARSMEASEAAMDEHAESLSALRTRRDSLAEHLASATQGSAVADARLEGLETRQQEREAAAEAADAEATRLEERLQELVAARNAATAALAERQAEVEAARSALREAEEARDTRVRDLEAARREAVEADASLTENRRRLESLTEDRREQLEAAASLAAEAAELEARLSEEAQHTGRAEAALAEADEGLEAAEAALAQTEDELSAATETVRRAREALARQELALKNLRSRADALEALFARQETGEATAVAEAAVPDAVLGTVARLLEVEPEWEAAVAAVLGTRLSGLVVRDMAAVDRALSTLGPDVTGTVTLVPATGAAATSWSGAAGLGPEDVARSHDAPGIVGRLLGDVAFVDDLAAARRALDSSHPPRLAVTRGGRLLADRGVARAGSPGRELLALERERRELPAALEAAGQALTAAAEAADTAAGEVQRLENRVGDLSEERSRAETRRRGAARAVEETRTVADRTEREIAWRRENEARAVDRAGALEAQISLVETAIEQLQGTVRAKADAAEALAEEVTRMEVTKEREQLQAAVARASEAAAEAAGARAVAASAEEEVAAARRTAAAQREEAARLETRRQELLGESGELSGDATRLAQQLEALDAEIGPADAALRETTRELREQGSQLEEARRRLSDVEARLSESRVAAARAESRVERLWEQIHADAELLPELESLPEQLPLEAHLDLDLPLPTVVELPADLEGRVGQLRRDLRTVGSIDMEALATFRESQERHQSLVEQRADLIAAADDLREVLGRLEAEMAEKFEVTFAEVAKEFAQTFPRLFGGGEARLVSGGESDEDAESSSSGINAGIDILARPPGKRSQPLALLSGGERALTAVALIFALLKASGTPFVVLDEVDAALDEANVNRFRDALESLAEDTQVVIITHNRGTVQTADTIYGVSMADDGGSQIVSLRVEELVAG